MGSYVSLGPLAEELVTVDGLKDNVTFVFKDMYIYFKGVVPAGFATLNWMTPHA